MPGAGAGISHVLPQSLAEQKLPIAEGETNEATIVLTGHIWQNKVSGSGRHGQAGQAGGHTKI